MSAFLVAVGAVVLGVMVLGGVVVAVGAGMDGLERRAGLSFTRAGAGASPAAVPGVEVPHGTRLPRREELLHAAGLVDGEHALPLLLLVGALEDGSITEHPTEPSRWLASPDVLPREAEQLPGWRDRFMDGDLRRAGAPMASWLDHARGPARLAWSRVRQDLVAWGLVRSSTTRYLARAAVVMLALVAGGAVVVADPGPWTVLVAVAWAYTGWGLSSALRHTTLKGEAVLLGWRKLHAETPPASQVVALGTLGLLRYEAIRMGPDASPSLRPPAPVARVVEHVRYGQAPPPTDGPAPASRARAGDVRPGPDKM